MRYDLARLGIDLDDIGSTVSWRTGLDLVAEIANDPASHFVMAKTEALYPASMGDLSIMAIAHGLGVQFPLPWDDSLRHTPVSDHVVESWYDTDNAFH